MTSALAIRRRWRLSLLAAVPATTRSSTVLRIHCAALTTLPSWRLAFLRATATHVARVLHGQQHLHFVDLDPAAKKHEAPGTKVWIGDSNSAELMQRIVAEIPGGAFDLIVDDGSHAPADVRGLFMQLFPLLKPGGIYAVEDLNSAWDKRGVVPERREVPLASGENGTHVDMLRDMIKTLNRVNFDPSYSAGVNGIDHLVGSIFCTEEACVEEENAS